MSSEQIRSFFEILQTLNPVPTTELEYDSPEQLLIAVILSAQSTDIAVNRVTKHLFSLAPTPQDIVELGESGIREKVRSLGLFRNKAKHVLGTCRILCARHAGKIPADRHALEALPGVGRKTANVVLNTVFSQPCIAVDTHVFRVANRTGLARGETVLDVERGLEQRVPPEFLLHVHHWLVLHGRYICKAQHPACDHCPVRACCLWEQK